MKKWLKARGQRGFYNREAQRSNCENRCLIENLEHRVLYAVSANINFQPASAAVPAGTIVDSGSQYGNRGNGYTYGWNRSNSTARDRNMTSDQRYDTVIHTQQSRNYTWEMAVPNGQYQVRLVAGDAAYYNSVYRFNVENTLALSGTPSSSSRWVEGTVNVNVTDGRLTVSNASGSDNNKLNFIEVREITAEPAPAPAPAPAPTGLVHDVRNYGARLDGTTDDAAAIQRAIDALPASGGTVLISGGMAGIGARGININNRSGVILAGSNSSSGLKLLKSLANSTDAAQNAAVRIGGSADCVVRNLRIDGLTPTKSIAINVFASTRVTIENNTVLDVAGETYGAIMATGNTDNRYIGNVIQRTRGTRRGLWVGNPYAGQYEIRPVISGNTISNIRGTGMAVVADGALIADNTISDCTGSGLVLSGGLSNGVVYKSKNITVERNTLRRNTHGIQGDSVLDSVLVDNVMVRNNLCERNTGSGIYAWRVSRWTITNNISRDNNYDKSGQGHGVLLVVARDCIVTDNDFYDTRTGSSRTQTNGVDLVAYAAKMCLENITVTNNRIRNNAGTGVFLTNVYDGTARGFNVTGNTLENNGGYGLFAFDEQPGDLTDVTIGVNTASGNTAGQIRVDASLL